MTQTFGLQYEFPVSAPTRSGYTFSGWFTGLTGGTPVTSASSVTQTAAHTLYAQWTANTYPVNFLCLGGGTPQIQTQTQTYDSTYVFPGVPTRPGHVFAGWFTGPNGSGTQVAAGTMFTTAGTQTLYAHWAAAYTVTFDGQGGTPSADSMSVAYGLPYGGLPGAARPGYTFSGWFTASTGGEEITDSTVATMESGHTLYARWTAKTYTVTFDGRGGTPSTSSRIVTYDAAYGTLPALGDPTGYTFAGWFTEVSGGTRVTGSTIVTTASDHTLYAQWTGNPYEAYFICLDGGAPEFQSVTQTYGLPYVFPDTPARAGHVFAGWFTETYGSGTQVTAETIFATTVSPALFAHWVERDGPVPVAVGAITVDASGDIFLDVDTAETVTVSVSTNLTTWASHTEGQGVVSRISPCRIRVDGAALGKPPAAFFKVSVE